MLVRKRFHQAAHLETLQRLLEARVSTHGLGVAVIPLVPHATISPHIFQPSKSGFSVLLYAFAHLFHVQYFTPMYRRMYHRTGETMNGVARGEGRTILSVVTMSLPSISFIICSARRTAKFQACTHAQISKHLLRAYVVIGNKTLHLRVVHA